MDSKNPSEALNAMDGLGFDDAAKVCPTSVARVTGLLSPSQKEIQAAIVQGQRQAQAHGQLLAFTSMCWDKLIHLLPTQAPLLTPSTGASLGHQAVVLLAAKKRVSPTA